MAKLLVRPTVLTAFSCTFNAALQTEQHMTQTSARARVMVRSVTACFALMLGACASTTPTREGGASQTAPTKGTAVSFYDAKSCCSSMADFHYAPLSLPATVVTHIEDANTVFEFPTGKSYFQAFRLPESPSGLTVTINSYFAGPVFFPNFLFLDDSYKPLRRVGSPDTHYVPPSTWVRGHYELTANVPAGDAARYLVVLTTSDDMFHSLDTGNGHFLMPAGGIYVPISTGPHIASHGPTGKIKLVVQPMARP